MGLYIGLMSGTSLDGVDGVLLRLDAAGEVTLLGHAGRALPDPLRARFAALNQSGADELHQSQLGALELAALYAEVVAELLRNAALQPQQVLAIGAHGQTVRHRPDCAYTVQLNAPAWLAERSGIAVVADFRSRDVAAGGQGAPLVPAFHRAVFARPGEDLAVLNLGGIANLSLLAADGGVLGFDTGPGNALLDLWAQRHLGRPFDAGGAWGAGGSVDAELLDAWLADPYFAAPPPKSTGRDHFDAAWIDAALRPGLDPRDVQATLAELSARSVAEALLRHLPRASTLLVCGGGARNADLVGRLRRLLPRLRVTDSDSRGLPAQQVEAAAFAWLAAQALAGAPGNLPAVTGARGPRVLGAIYPA
jgi:anhydro-N-acetylmuramic acid kinase